MQIRFLLLSLCIGLTLGAAPKISIITSVYDGDFFIEGFLHDITQQTIFDQCELILINANSPGHEDEVINKYLQKYPNIIYKKLDTDPGLYGVWNVGIKMAQGGYISNANLDDRLAFNCYEVHSAFLDNHADVDLVYSDKYITSTPNETFKNHTGTKWFPSPYATAETMDQCWPCANPMWRATMHTRFGYFDPTYKCSGDWEMWMRALEGGAIFKKVPDYLLLYYHNPQGISTGKMQEQKNREDAKIIERYGYLWGVKNYLLYYKAARALERADRNDQQTWQLAINYYLKAFALKPRRAEPLVRIAQYYCDHGQSALAYLFAKRALALPYPENDEVFVEKELYDCARYEILGICSWYVNEFDVGELALKKAVEARPDMAQLQHNLKFYTDRKK